MSSTSVNNRFITSGDKIWQKYKFFAIGNFKLVSFIIIAKLKSLEGASWVWSANNWQV